MWAPSNIRTASSPLGTRVIYPPDTLPGVDDLNASIRHALLNPIGDSEPLPELLDDCAKVYARHFTAEELTELAAFYGTPLGQKLIATQPVLIAELNQCCTQSETALRGVFVEQACLPGTA